MQRMATALMILVWSVVGPTPVAAAGSDRAESPDAAAVRLAQALLDERLWTQVVRIENRDPTRPFPAVTWATLFELQDRLWIYTPRFGTCSLARESGRNAEDRADLTAVLRTLHPGFGAYAVVVDDDAAGPLPSVRATDDLGLPNGCVVRSLARWRALQRRAGGLRAAFLLFYYGGRGASRWGHTVLCYATRDGWYCWDPEDVGGTSLIGASLSPDPVAVARRVAPDPLASRVVDARRLNLMPMETALPSVRLASRPPAWEAGG